MSVDAWVTREVVVTTWQQRIITKCDQGGRIKAGDAARQRYPGSPAGPV